MHCFPAEEETHHFGVQVECEAAADASSRRTIERDATLVDEEVLRHRRRQDFRGRRQPAVHRLPEPRRFFADGHLEGVDLCHLLADDAAYLGVGQLFGFQRPRLYRDRDKNDDD